jgi:hypothetical protein
MLLKISSTKFYQGVFTESAPNICMLTDEHREGNSHIFLSIKLDKINVQKCFTSFVVSVAQEVEKQRLFFIP